MRSMLTVRCPQVHLEVGELDVDPAFLYDTETYDDSESSTIWWHEAWKFTDRNWVRLSAPLHIEPQDAFWVLLSHRERPSLPLPIIITTFFLISHGDPHPSVRTDLFSDVSHAVSDLLLLLPPQLPITLVAPDQLEQLTASVMNAILHGVKPIPWPTYDGDSFVLMLQLVERFWAFPPDLVRCFVDNEDTEHGPVMQAEHDQADITSSRISSDGLWLLSRMSMLRGWNYPLPSVRGLPIRSQTQQLILVIYQALVLMHPDAPPISDALLAWLCDGTLGSEDSVPMVDLWDLDRVVEERGISTTALLDHISTLRPEAAVGVHKPMEQWTFQVSTRLPFLKAIRIATIRSVVSPEGMWIRLIPVDNSWGVLLWWRPQVEPPPSLFLAAQTKIEAFALHTILWELWRDLCVTGTLEHG